jgi:PhzF family phenazine biosynthesis protein
VVGNRRVTGEGVDQDAGMTPRLYQVDAFAETPFSGNQAGVCVLDTPAPEAWMRSMAGETDLPATAFVAPAGQESAPLAGGDAGTADWSLRWFTARDELALCGHGTLAASHVLLHEVGVGQEVIRYATGAGPLTARSVGDGAIELDFPAYAPTPAPDDTAAATAALFPDGAPPGTETHRGFQDLLVVVPSPDHVRDLAPDTAAVVGLDARCVIVSAATPVGAGGNQPDIVSRVFGVIAGGIEDPVTGSAHCLLGPFWAQRLGRSRLRARQASPRGGDLVVEVRDDRVALTGRAITVLRSELADAVAPTGALSGEVTA